MNGIGYTLGMKTVEAILYYAERWATAILRIKGKNTKQVEELRGNMQELIRLSNEIERVFGEVDIDHMPKEEHKMGAIIDRYSTWFDGLDSYDDLRDRAAQILAFAEVHSDYWTIKQKVNGLVEKQHPS